MLCLNSNPFSFLLLLLVLPLLTSTFNSFSHGASYLQPSPISEKDEREFAGMEGLNSKRYLGETTNGTYLVLAANRTHRKNPFNGFNYYTGGWNILDSSYLITLGFSGAPPIIAGIIWFVAFGIFLITLFICLCCCRKNHKHIPYSPKAYVVSLAFLCLFTIMAIIGITILFIGQARFQNSIVGIMSYILKEANTVMVNLEELLESLMSAKKVGVGPAALPSELQNNVDAIGTQINIVATQLTNVTTTNANAIRAIMFPVEVALFTIAITCLVLALLGSCKSTVSVTVKHGLLTWAGGMCAILGLECLVYTFVILGWILVLCTFVMSGIFLVIHNGVADTCQAMTEWLHNPYASSTLEELLPRVNNETAESIFLVTKGLTVGIVNVINGVTANISNSNLSPEAKFLYYNQSGPLVPLLCNPYNPDLTDRKCSSGEVEFTNASKVWKNYVCEVSDTGICKTQGRLTPDNFTQLTASVNVSYGLYKYSPFIVELIDATFIKQTFSNIKDHNCPNLTKYSDWTYSGFITTSVALMKLIMIWVVYATQRRHRDDTKKSTNDEKGSKSGSSIGNRDEKGSIPRYDEDPFDDQKESMGRNGGDHFGDRKGPNGYV